MLPSIAIFQPLKYCNITCNTKHSTTVAILVAILIAINAILTTLVIAGRHFKMFRKLRKTFFSQIHKQHFWQSWKKQHLKKYHLNLLKVNVCLFLPAQRYASAGNSDRNMSVCLSVCHAPVLCQNEESQRHDFFTIWQPQDSSFLMPNFVTKF